MKERENRLKIESTNSGYSFPHSPGPIGSISGWPRAFPLTSSSNAMSIGLSSGGGSKEKSSRDELNSKFDSLNLPSSSNSRAPSPISPRLDS